jgi:sugar lactone lactonase YvrE
MRAMLINGLVAVRPVRAPASAVGSLFAVALVTLPLGCAANADASASMSSTSDSGNDGPPGLQAEGSTSVTPSGDGSPPPSEVEAGPPPIGTVLFVPGVTVSTIAGSAENGARDGTGAAAEFDNPTGIAIDGSGDLVVTDYDDALVRLVTLQGVVTTVASASNFVDPFDVAVASDGTYYVATDADDTGTKSPTSGTIWHVTAPSGGGVAKPVVFARGMYRPRGVTLVAGGGLFVSDRDESLVELLPAPNGALSVLAGTNGDIGFQDGTGHTAQFDAPVGVASLPDGSWVVADSYNNRIRHVTSTGVVTTFAGDGTYALNDGPAATARFAFPSAVAADASGIVYVSDLASHRIRRIDLSGNVETLAGDGIRSYADGAGSAAEFYGQEGIAVTSDGKSLYVSDGNGGDGSAHSHVRALSIP